MNSFGYSDIKKIYSTDTINAKRPFFNSTSLQEVEVQVESNITKTTLEQNSDSILVCYQLVGPLLVIERDGILTSSEHIIKEIIKPVFVLTDISGKVGTIKFDASLTELTTGIYKDIISRMQFVQPRAKVDSWQTTEENTIGTYTANYHLTGHHSSGNEYHKELLDYVKYKSKRNDQKIDTDNNTRIETEHDGTIKAITISEAQITRYDKDTISASGTKVAIELIVKAKVQNSIRVALLKLEKSTRYGRSTTLSQALSKDEITKMSYTGTLGPDNWQLLTQRLYALDGSANAEEDALVLKFRAIFYLRPETCTKAIALLENEPKDTTVFLILFRALSISETAKATDALASILVQNKSNIELLSALMPVLATTSYPTVKAVSAVQALAFNTEGRSDSFITSTAQLTLGGMANKLRASDTVLADRLALLLLEKMKVEKDTVQQLLVLGNSGSFIVFPYVRSLIENKSISDLVKLEAISALRLIKHKEVSAYLESLLQTKPIELQQKAKEVIEFQKKKVE